MRVVLTVERFAWDKAGRRDTKALLADPIARATLVEDIVGAVTRRDAGGVNLDFEPLPRAVRGHFVRLVRDLRAGLDAVDPSLQLTFELTADVSSYPLRRLTAAGGADAAVLMGYEYRTSGHRSQARSPHCETPEASTCAIPSSWRWSARRQAGSILALPWYGRAWSTRTDESEH